MGRAVQSCWPGASALLGECRKGCSLMHYPGRRGRGIPCRCLAQEPRSRQSLALKTPGDGGPPMTSSKGRDPGASSAALT